MCILIHGYKSNYSLIFLIIVNEKKNVEYRNVNLKSLGTQNCIISFLHSRLLWTKDLAIVLGCKQVKHRSSSNRRLNKTF